MDATSILKDGAAAGLFAKILVDIAKDLPVRMPSWSRPIVAFGCSEICAWILFFAGPDSLTRQTIAGTVLVGLVATGGAMLSTMGQTRADKVEEKVETALKLESGSTRADLEKEMAKNAAEAGRV